MRIPWRVATYSGAINERGTDPMHLDPDVTPEQRYWWRITDAMKGVPAIDDACQAISTLLENHQFFLHDIRGTKEPDLARDEKLADGLRKHNLLAVLECLYQIRCNIFHGEKDFAPRQAELLAPAITLLEAVVSLSREALHEALHEAAL